MKHTMTLCICQTWVVLYPCPGLEPWTVHQRWMCKTISVLVDGMAAIPFFLRRHLETGSWGSNDSFRPGRVLQTDVSPLASERESLEKIVQWATWLHEGCSTMSEQHADVGMETSLIKRYLDTWFWPTPSPATVFHQGLSERQVLGCLRLFDRMQWWKTNYTQESKDMWTLNLDKMRCITSLLYFACGRHRSLKKRFCLTIQPVRVCDHPCCTKGQKRQEHVWHQQDPGYLGQSLLRSHHPQAWPGTFWSVTAPNWDRVTLDSETQELFGCWVGEHCGEDGVLFGRVQKPGFGGGFCSFWGLICGGVIVLGYSIIFFEERLSLSSCLSHCPGLVEPLAAPWLDNLCMFARRLAA